VQVLVSLCCYTMYVGYLAISFSWF